MHPDITPSASRPTGASSNADSRSTLTTSRRKPPASKNTTLRTAHSPLCQHRPRRSRITLGPALLRPLQAYLRRLYRCRRKLSTGTDYPRSPETQPASNNGLAETITSSKNGFIGFLNTPFLFFYFDFPQKAFSAHLRNCPSLRYPSRRDQLLPSKIHRLRYILFAWWFWQLPS